MGQGDQRRTLSVILTGRKKTPNSGGDTQQKESGGSRLPPLVNPRRNHQASWLSYEGLGSAALLTAALLAATFLTATALLASATLLLALLALTFLFIPIFLLAATALLSATTTLLAALLSNAFDGFVRITFCFHSTFLYFSY